MARTQPQTQFEELAAHPGTAGRTAANPERWPNRLYARAPGARQALIHYSLSPFDRGCEYRR